MSCAPAEVEAVVAAVVDAHWPLWFMEWLIAGTLGYFLRWSRDES